MSEPTWDATLRVGIEPDPAVFAKALDDSTVQSVHIRLLLPERALKKTITLIAKKSRPWLQAVCLESASFDDGEVRSKALVPARSATKLWQNLPNLARLDLRGTGFFESIEHDELREFSMTGFPVGSTGPAAAGDLACPELESLRWAFGGDRHGVAFPPEALDAPWSEGVLPSLRRLDLAEADLDGSLVTSGEFLESSLVARLESLTFPRGEVERDELEAALPSLVNLDRIVVSGPECADVDPRVEIMPAVQPTPVVVKPTLYFSNATDEEMAEACASDGAKGSIREVNATWHKLRADGMESLGRLAAQNPELHTIDIGRNLSGSFGADGLAVFTDAIGRHEGLRHLDMNYNSLEGGGSHLATLVSSLPNLEWLGARLNYLGDDEQTDVVQALGNSTKLRTLDVTKARSGPQSAQAWGGFESEVVEHFDYSGIKHTPEDMSMALGDLGRRLPRLRALGLTMSKLESSAVQTLAEGLDGHEQLQELAISMVGDDKAYAALGDVLGGTQLRWLELDDDGATSVAPQAISALSRAASLESLSFESSLPSMPDAESEQVRLDALMDALCGLPNLRHIGNLRTKVDDGAEQIADRLAETSVRSFSRIRRRLIGALMARNAISSLTFKQSTYNLDETLEWIEANAGANQSLTTLRLEDTDLNRNLLKALKKITKSRTSIRRVELCAWLDNDERFALIKHFSSLEHVEVLAMTPFHGELADAVDEWLAKSGKLRVEPVDPAPVGAWR